jgi:pimeloyl-ACP methyl ester carboxylesterase
MDNIKQKLSLPTKEEIDEREKKVEFYDTKQGTHLAVYEYGDSNGQPIIFYHGTGSHIQANLIHKPAIENGFRIIAPDRPGVGLSHFRKGWTALEYAYDMEELADILGITKFGAIGISGAGPTLMATAFTIPKRLNCVVDLACAMPVYSDPNFAENLGKADRFFAKIGTRLPLWIFSIPFSILGFMQTLMKSPSSFAKMFDSSLCQSDKDIFKLPEFQYLIMRDFQHLFKQGAKGPAYDAQIVYRSWGFDLSDITIHLEIFQGTADKFIPSIFSEYLTKTARDCSLNLIEGEGHFCHLAYGYRTMEKIRSIFYQ